MRSELSRTIPVGITILWYETVRRSRVTAHRWAKKLCRSGPKSPLRCVQASRRPLEIALAIHHINENVFCISCFSSTPTLFFDQFWPNNKSDVATRFFNTDYTMQESCLLAASTSDHRYPVGYAHIIINQAPGSSKPKPKFSNSS